MHFSVCCERWIVMVIMLQCDVLSLRRQIGVWLAGKIHIHFFLFFPAQFTHFRQPKKNLIFLCGFLQRVHGFSKRRIKLIANGIKNCPSCVFSGPTRHVHTPKNWKRQSAAHRLQSCRRERIKEESFFSLFASNGFCSNSFCCWSFYYFHKNLLNRFRFYGSKATVLLFWHTFDTNKKRFRFTNSSMFIIDCFIHLKSLFFTWFCYYIVLSSDKKNSHRNPYEKRIHTSSMYFDRKDLQSENSWIGKWVRWRREEKNEIIVNSNELNRTQILAKQNYRPLFFQKKKKKKHVYKNNIYKSSHCFSLRISAPHAYAASVFCSMYGFSYVW